MIRALNPAYRRDIVPGATTPSPIRLPISYISTFIDRQDSIYAAESNTDKRLEVAVEDAVVKTTTAKSSRNAQWHKVRSGDNLGAIARRYGTTVSKLKKLNGLRNNNIRAGQRLRVR
jgi:membrane-bound lytic murein transglycosylase D